MSKYLSIIQQIFVFGLATIALTGCSEEEPDVRDQAVGNYLYTVRYYMLDEGKLRYYGVSTDDTGSMVVEKSWMGLRGIEGNTLWFTAEKITAAKEGLGFDVKSVEQQGVMIEGYDGAKLSPDQNSDKFNGVYHPETERLTLYVQFPASNEKEQWIVVAEMSAVKQ